MDITEFTPTYGIETALSQYRKQFNVPAKVGKMSLKESRVFLDKVSSRINTYKDKYGIFESEKDLRYGNLLLLREATLQRISYLTESQGSNMKQSYFKALKHVAKGGKLSESDLARLGVSSKLRSILENRQKSIRLIEFILKQRKSAINEDVEDVDAAQVVLAAQDIVDQVQKMIETFADIQYKELPALQDGIRKEMGVKMSQSFNQQVLSAIQTLTQSLEETRTELTNAVGLLTGEQSADMGGELGLEEPGDEDLDMDLNFGGEEEEEGGEMEPGMPEEEPEAEEDLMNLGRERR